MFDVLWPAALNDIDEWVSGSWKWMLLSSGFVPDPDTQEFVADIVADEVTAGGYVRVAVTTPTVQQTGSGGPTYPMYLMDNPDFGSPTGGQIATYLVLYREVTNDADSPIIAAWEVALQLDGSAQVIEFVAQPGISTSTNPTKAWLLTGVAQHRYAIDQNYLGND